jgi:hypothetical protein
VVTDGFTLPGFVKFGIPSHQTALPNGVVASLEARRRKYEADYQAARDQDLLAYEQLLQSQKSAHSTITLSDQFEARPSRMVQVTVPAHHTDAARDEPE